MQVGIRDTHICSGAISVVRVMAVAYAMNDPEALPADPPDLLADDDNDLDDADQGGDATRFHNAKGNWWDEREMAAESRQTNDLRSTPLRVPSRHANTGRGRRKFTRQLHGFDDSEVALLVVSQLTGNAQEAVDTSVEGTTSRLSDGLVNDANAWTKFLPLGMWQDAGMGREHARTHCVL